VPIKFKDNETALKVNEKTREFLQIPFLHRVRDNWIDIALPLELGESLNRASMRGGRFEALVRGGSIP